jgi:hypothetical protein
MPPSTAEILSKVVCAGSLSSKNSWQLLAFLGGILAVFQSHSLENGHLTNMLKSKQRIFGRRLSGPPAYARLAWRTENGII